ncbi:MAG TPA: 16S rRNA (cytosine(1402)-N(4))-methyltransferase RsmH [Sphingomonadaceae bacterium]|nr:16S rRNA (cytosine(1402)-N(4))-methyltransferase RsmH [Sphingomonadaceae bacterium]
MTPNASPAHVPVLLPEVLAALAPVPGEHHVDGTFGAGGYARAILEAGAAVTAFDRDPDAIREGQALAAAAPRLRLVEDRFANLAAHVDAADGVTLDIGVSSMQLDRAERGFSFGADGPLDMRMSRDGQSAAEFLNSADEAVIADILYAFGEEPRSRRIARAIVAARPLTRTAELAAVVRTAVGHHPGMKKDPATRTFQAIRIHLNGELDELAEGLEAAEKVLKPGGRLAVVTFHSLEDRIVKRFLKDRGGIAPARSRHAPAEVAPAAAATFSRIQKAVRPSAAEQAANPRSRSATLRSATRTAAPPVSPASRQEGSRS